MTTNNRSRGRRSGRSLAEAMTHRAPAAPAVVAPPGASRDDNTPLNARRVSHGTPYAPVRKEKKGGGGPAKQVRSLTKSAAYERAYANSPDYSREKSLELLASDLAQIKQQTDLAKSAVWVPGKNGGPARMRIPQPVATPAPQQVGLTPEQLQQATLKDRPSSWDLQHNYTLSEPIYEKGEMGPGTYVKDAATGKYRFATKKV
jgi:hypothetical protein